MVVGAATNFIRAEPKVIRCLNTPKISFSLVYFTMGVATEASEVVVTSPKRKLLANETVFVKYFRQGYKELHITIQINHNQDMHLQDHPRLIIWARSQKNLCNILLQSVPRLWKDLVKILQDHVNILQDRQRKYEFKK